MSKNRQQTGRPTDELRLGTAEANCLKDKIDKKRHKGGTYASLAEFYNFAFEKIYTNAPDENGKNGIPHTDYSGDKLPASLNSLKRAYANIFSGQRPLGELYLRLLEECLEEDRSVLLPKHFPNTQSVVLTPTTPPPQTPIGDALAPNAITAVGSARPQLRIAGAERVKAWRWTYHQLLDEFIKLDCESVFGLADSPELEGNTDQWAPVFEAYPNTWRMLVEGESETICGYWHFAPLRHEDYEDMKNGRLTDCQIIRDRVPGALEGWDYVYFVQFALRKDYMSHGNALKLLESVIDVFGLLAKNQVFIQEVCANAVTAEGERLCQIFGLNRIRKHPKGGEIFAASIQNVLGRSFVQRNRELIAAYDATLALPGSPRPSSYDAMAGEIFDVLAESDFEVRGAETREEVRLIWELDHDYYGENDWPEEKLCALWKAFPQGCQCVYQGMRFDRSSYRGSFGLWPVTRAFAGELEQGRADEDSVGVETLRGALKSPVQYWYFSGIEIKEGYRRTQALPRLLSIGLRNVWKACSIGYPCRVYACEFSSSGGKLLSGFGFREVRERAEKLKMGGKAGWGVFRMDLNSSSDFEELLEGRRL